jgi:5-hydroxyisourate hydrolase-like protein (transthyretin family)
VIQRIDTNSMSILSVRVLVDSVGMPAVAVAVVMEEEETNNVRQETARTDYEDDQRVRDILWLDESLDRFEEDGET